MKTTEILSIAIYGIVGCIALNMAFKNLVSKKWIGFYEKAVTTSWDSLENPLKYVILALMRVSGLGFLMVSILLIVFPIVNHFINDTFLRVIIPAISFVFCLGLFLVNYLLHKQTNSRTPWKASLIAMTAIIIGLILSLL